MKRLYYLIIIALTFLIAMPKIAIASCGDGIPVDNCNNWTSTCYNVGPGDPIIPVSISGPINTLGKGVCLSIVPSQQNNCPNIGSFVLIDMSNGTYDIDNPATNYYTVFGSLTQYFPNFIKVYNPALYGASSQTTRGSIYITSDNSTTYSAAVGLSCYEPVAPTNTGTSWSYWNNSSGGYNRYIDFNYGSPSSIDKTSFMIENCSTGSYVGDGYVYGVWQSFQSSGVGIYMYETNDYIQGAQTTLPADCTWHTLFTQKNINSAPIFFMAAGYNNFHMGFGYNGIPMIPVILSSFSATSGNNHITIQWQTSQENSNAGFNIYRSTDNVHYAKVNTTIIAPNQHNYTYTDTNVVNGTKYYYKLEDVSLSGAATMHNTIAWAIPSPANLDGSGVVDGNDLIILSQAMGSKPGMSNWNPKADLNGDGVVDEKDLQILQQYFGDQLSGVADSNANTSLQSAQYENNMLNSVSLLPIANTNISAPPTVAIPQQHQINH